MTSTALPGRDRPPRFLASTIGRKIVMAVTGLMLLGFVVAHLSGNLLVFAGPEAIREYAVWLREVGHGVILWVLRGGLLVAALLHIWAATSLTLENRAARPTGYRSYDPTGSTLASRTMRWSGYLLLAYIGYHLLDMTFGSVHPDFVHLDPYHNMVVAFSRKPETLVYIGMMVLLGLHLYHGTWSALRTLGLSHPRYARLARIGSQVLGTVLAAGYIAIPLAVLTGVLR